MLNLSTNTQIFLCTAPADMRKSFDGLSALVTSVMNQDLLSGHLFLFLNRRRDHIKLMYWDRDGLGFGTSVLRRGRLKRPGRSLSNLIWNSTPLSSPCCSTACPWPA